jgi:hypothetical protein
VQVLDRPDRVGEALAHRVVTDADGTHDHLRQDN